MYHLSPPSAFSEVFRNTLSTLNTKTWSFFCLSLNLPVFNFLIFSAVTLTVTAVIAITSSGVTAHD